jgi:mono/diheme cytochrome c family protein
MPLASAPVFIFKSIPRKNQTGCLNLCLILMKGRCFMFAKCILATVLISISTLAFCVDKNGRSDDLIEHGKYLVKIAGCNDCHTPGYPEANGSIAESEWLVGSDVGFRGPWGTTYASNLRLSLSRLTAEQWLAAARAPMRPPMPSPSLNAMTDHDLLAIYSFIRSLGVAGQPAPNALGPDEKVSTHYIHFSPVKD